MDFNKLRLIGDDGICAIINRELHRYYSIDVNFIDSLKSNYLWFSDPENFNDPYDCNLDFDYENTKEEIEIYFKEINNDPANAFRKVGEDELKLRVLEYVVNPKLLQQRARIQNIEEINKIGICCFSESDNKLLMWSHYGNKHKGACLSFDINEDKLLFSKYPYVVEYPLKYPTINWINERKAIKPRRFTFATKSGEWSYEEEVRIIRDDTNPPFRNQVIFNKKALKAIKFGYKSSAEDRAKTIEIIYNISGYEHVRFYLAKLKHLDFGIEYEEIFREQLLKTECQ